MGEEGYVMVSVGELRVCMSSSMRKVVLFAIQLLACSAPVQDARDLNLASPLVVSTLHNAPSSEGRYKYHSTSYKKPNTPAIAADPTNIDVDGCHRLTALQILVLTSVWTTNANCNLLLSVLGVRTNKSECSAHTRVLGGKEFLPSEGC